jgi:hypothetical protein
MKLGILTSATADKCRDWFLSNEQIAGGARKINAACGSTCSWISSLSSSMRVFRC